ncbi:TolC family protein [Solitalea koreensis]|uniref:Outer membrane protein TolC n=1 Tax=Solitalea koreensis TaxID=543615 RepID=A0A521BEE9_9SPHI|nr:TolC family protein [Solitalea koreensis]SMO45485.1 Outer membrane protein TolC [Solitalea koreensis]
MRKTLLFFIFLLSALSCLAQRNNLDFYISHALKNSPLLKDYQNQMASNSIDSLLLKATYKPQVNASSTNFYAPTINGIGYDQVITNGGGYNALVTVSKSITDSKKVAAQLATIQLQNEGIKNTSTISEQDLKKSITAQYIITFGDIQQLNFNKEVLTLLKEEEQLLKAFTEKNVYRQTDYLTFLVILQQQELLLKQVNIQYQNDYATLNYLCGINDTSKVNLPTPAIELQPLPQISNSIFLKQFDIQSLKLANSKALVDLIYRPKASVYIDAGYNSTLTYQPYKNFGTSFGISVSVPIYDGKQRKMQYDKLTFAEKTTTDYKNFFINQYNQQIAQLTQQLLSTEGLILEINKQIKYSESLIIAERKLLQTGDLRVADFVIAINNYLNAKNLLTQNTINRLQIINQINYWNR